MYIKKLLLIFVLILTGTVESFSQLIYELDDFETEDMGFTYFESYRSYSSSTSGDINGDGIEDLIFSGNNNVYVVFGDANREDKRLSSGQFSSDLDGTIGFRIKGYSSQDTDDGIALATGDFNDDGFEDIVIGVSGRGLNEGSIALIYGTDKAFEAELNVTEMSIEQGFLVEGEVNSASLGLDVAAADINGDGIDDLLFFNDGGELLIGVYGSSEGIQDTDISENLGFAPDYEKVFRIEANYSNTSVDRKISTGDFNGDGLVDFVMTDPANSSDRGMVVIVYGIEEHLTEDINVFSLEKGEVKFINARNNEGSMGYSVATADMNNDGMDELIVGAPFSDINEDNYSGQDHGLIYIFQGTEIDSVSQVDTDTLSLVQGVTTIVLSQENSFQTHEVGRSMAVGDVNVDGYKDLLIGTGSDMGRRPGNTYLIFGAEENPETEISLLELTEEQGFTIYGERDQFDNPTGIGGRLVSMGDFNGDGFSDIVTAGNIFGEKEYLYVLDNLAGITVSNEIDSEVPKGFTLNQNYPNPFNPSTNISYSLKKSGNIILEVFDMLGRKVATLVNEKKSAGNYTATFDASNLSSGMYIYRLEAGNFSQTRKLMLIK